MVVLLHLQNYYVLSLTGSVAHPSLEPTDPVQVPANVQAGRADPTAPAPDLVQWLHWEGWFCVWWTFTASWLTSPISSSSLPPPLMGARVIGRSEKAALVERIQQM